MKIGNKRDGIIVLASRRNDLELCMFVGMFPFVDYSLP